MLIISQKLKYLGFTGSVAMKWWSKGKNAHNLSKHLGITGCVAMNGKEVEWIYMKTEEKSNMNNLNEIYLIAHAYPCNKICCQVERWWLGEWTHLKSLAKVV